MLTVNYCYTHRYLFRDCCNDKYIEVFRPSLEEDGLYVYSHRFLKSTVRRFCREIGIEYLDILC